MSNQSETQNITGGKLDALDELTETWKSGDREEVIHFILDKNTHIDKFEKFTDYLEETSETFNFMIQLRHMKQEGYLR